MITTRGEKKGYHIYMLMEVMREFKSLCAREGIPVGHGIETLMLRELERRKITSSQGSLLLNDERY